MENDKVLDYYLGFVGGGIAGIAFDGVMHAVSKLPEPKPAEILFFGGLGGLVALLNVYDSHKKKEEFYETYIKPKN